MQVQTSRGQNSEVSAWDLTLHDGIHDQADPTARGLKVMCQRVGKEVVGPSIRGLSLI